MGTERLSREHIGRIVRVRQRQFLVDDVSPRQFGLLDDCQALVRRPGSPRASLEVIWEQELDAQIPEAETWGRWVTGGSTLPTGSRPITGTLPLEPGDGLADRPAPGPVPGGDRHRALPARAVADGPRDASGEPLRRRHSVVASPTNGAGALRSGGMDVDSQGPVVRRGTGTGGDR